MLSSIKHLKAPQTTSTYLTQVLNIVCTECGKPCRSDTERDLHTKRTGHTTFADKVLLYTMLYHHGDDSIVHNQPDDNHIKHTIIFIAQHLYCSTLLCTHFRRRQRPRFSTPRWK